MKQKKYIELYDLDVYKLARKYSKKAWKFYDQFDWRIQKNAGDQMIRSVDSVGANIAEGYGRFHYLDKNRFYYHARGSLLESRHWIGLLYERALIQKEEFEIMKTIAENIEMKINGLIKSQYRQKHS